jgi:tetratricopeptide (TPR) repeat protein
MKFSRFFLKLIASLSASSLLSGVCVIAGVTEAQSRELVPTSATKQLKANLSIEQIDQIPQEITLLLTEGKITGKASNTLENGYGLSYSNSTIAARSGVVVLNPLNSYQKWIGGQEAITVADNQSESKLTADDWNNRGLEKQNSGDFTGAIEDYTEGINIDPNDAPAYNNRGNTRSKLGDFTGAIEDYTQGINIDPNDAPAYNNRGIARSKLGDFTGAIEDYTQVISLDPDDVRAYNNRGNARSKLGDNQGAIEDYTQVISLDPNYAPAYNNRGNARSKLGDFTGAIEDYTQGINIDPNYALAYYNRGVARNNLGDITGAIEDLEKAAELLRQQGDPRVAEVEETIRQMR